MGLKSFVYGCLVYAALGAASTAAQVPRAVEQARQYRQANEHAIVRELVDLLAIPNVATDEANIRRNAEKLREMLERRGFRVRRLPIAGRGPVVLGELAVHGERSR